MNFSRSTCGFYVAALAAAIIVASPSPAVTNAAEVASQAAPWPATVLMTNDDGIDTPGIRALASTLGADSDVYVVAPTGNRSGSSSYIGTISEAMSVTEVEAVDGVSAAYAVSGYPADAVVWGIRGLLADDPPDLVISGINDGANAGGAWFLSGTVGAARTAAFLGIPALAVSGYDANDPEAVRQVADWVSRFARSPMVRGLEPGEYLLVNMPRNRMDEVTGVVVVPLDLMFMSIGVVQEGDAGHWRTRLGFDSEMVEGGDWAALRDRKIVITPMRVGEMQPLDRYRDMLESVPPPAGEGE